MSVCNYPFERPIVDDIEQIASLYSHVLAAEKQQNEINEALNHIEQQQRDLASTLDAYEKISQEILGGQGSTLRSLDTGPADHERDKKSVFFFFPPYSTNLCLTATCLQLIFTLTWMTCLAL